MYLGEITRNTLLVLADAAPQPILFGGKAPEQALRARYGGTQPRREGLERRRRQRRGRRYRGACGGSGEARPCHASGKRPCASTSATRRARCPCAMQRSLPCAVLRG
ncbi:hypothetical protein EDB85DRAFT_83109 [Lactarius pseudohatsudake]|nr:hypothetical protein EDB85DRAFT_83109 [Lactarius pseudohatsudake]